MLIIMETIFGTFIAIILVDLLIWFFFWGRQSEMESHEVVYIIHFISAIPDISKNDKIMEEVGIIEQTSDGYVVHSTINDSRLHKLITQEYSLDPKQVHVHSRIYEAMPL